MPRLTTQRLVQGLSADFLALEDHVADHEQQDLGRDHADDLRPGDQDASAERQRRAEHGALQLAQIDRPSARVVGSSSATTTSA